MERDNLHIIKKFTKVLSKLMYIFGYVNNIVVVSYFEGIYCIQLTCGSYIQGCCANILKKKKCRYFKLRSL